MRALSAAAAVDVMKRSGFAVEVERMLKMKVNSPLAATVGAILLLKGNRLDLMHDWTRNLANWFPALADGVVLWTEQCRRKAGGSLDAGQIGWFVDTLSGRSLPFTTDCFGLAVDILRDIKRGRLAADKATLEQADILDRRFDAAMPYFRDAGLFCPAISVATPPGLANGSAHQKLPR